MEQKYNLKKLPVLDSMHDQRIQNIEWREKVLILHYNDLHYDDSEEFRSCDVMFFGVDDSDMVAEVRKRNGLIVEGTRYYDVEFLEFITTHRYNIETIRFYYGYETVIIEAALIDENGGYCDDCVIKISAHEILYHWK
ncbi:MAG TPA: hypothetical protein DHW61_12285 [Lachnoclostridium phytofermentans]|uniref:Uncharacterized protein n=1 Tax=Lachnoclostridium phytofermentans TaxID=66219 RepID=A0A3D2X8D0_9FIRM|nr:hypothetical protein [Lachnoclostridium sp.]HCL03164.1 hypothetical protein [Lachnoclostridium phytofermentans]